MKLHRFHNNLLDILPNERTPSHLNGYALCLVDMESWLLDELNTCSRRNVKYIKELIELMHIQQEIVFRELNKHLNERETD